MATIGYGYGSEWHLLQYLGRRRDAFTRTIEDLTRVSSIHWQDHTETAPPLMHQRSGNWSA